MKFQQALSVFDLPRLRDEVSDEIRDQDTIRTAIIYACGRSRLSYNPQHGDILLFRNRRDAVMFLDHWTLMSQRAFRF